jgi:hypothetical protein
MQIYASSMRSLRRLSGTTGIMTAAYETKLRSAARPLCGPRVDRSSSMNEPIGEAWEML